MVDWRKRKRGSPNQIGKPFPVDKESMQQKKSTLSKLRERFAGQSHGRQEHEYVEKLKELIREHTQSGESKLANGILTESDVEYLEKKGLIKFDPYTEEISLTEEGQVTLLGEKMKRQKRELKSLTELEKQMIMDKRELYDNEG